jgi:beta-aspartyl-dipeptidase (metallo-type)
MLERKGRIAPGMDADLIVLDERMGAHSVMALGRWHVRDGRILVKGALEGAA